MTHYALLGVTAQATLEELIGRSRHDNWVVLMAGALYPVLGHAVREVFGS